MATTYYDRLNYAFDKFAELKLPPSAQLVYLHILHEDNCFGRTGRVRIADSSLLVKTGLSKSTITDAKRRLQNSKLLDFQTEKNGSHIATLYTLPEGRAEGRAETRAEGRAETRAELNYYTTPMPVREEEREKEVSTTTTTNARANPKNRVTADLDRELEQRLDAAVKELDKDVRAAWIETKAESPYGGDLLDLIDLQKRYGAKTLAETITYCRRNRQPNQWGGSGEVNINYVQRVLAKGSEKRGNVIKFPASTGTNPEPDIWDARQSQLPF